MSCATNSKSPNPAAQKRAEGTLFTFQAAAAPRIPVKFYVFPPLKSNSKGVPIEKLIPVTDAQGSTSEWNAASGKSNRLRDSLKEQLRASGYEVISFGELLRVNQPYSVLVISSFYSKPEAVENNGQPNETRASLVMLKGSIFDIDLNPSKKKNSVKVDGLIRFPAATALPDPVGSGMMEAFRKIGENESGYMYLN